MCLGASVHVDICFEGAGAIVQQLSELTGPAHHTRFYHCFIYESMSELHVSLETCRAVSCFLCCLMPSAIEIRKVITTGHFPRKPHRGHESTWERLRAPESVSHIEPWELWVRYSHRRVFHSVTLENLCHEPYTRSCKIIQVPCLKRRPNVTKNQQQHPTWLQHMIAYGDTARLFWSFVRTLFGVYCFASEVKSGCKLKYSWDARSERFNNWAGQGLEWVQLALCHYVH